jgi:hypothetical protein
MYDSELKTSDEWLKLRNEESHPINIVISEPIGWNDISWEEPITNWEFEERLGKSKIISQNLLSDNSDDDFHDHIPGLD